MTKTPKRGRPRKPYVASWGDHINGLRRRPSDGRWVIAQTGETYAEPDERRAVARFKRWEAEQADNCVEFDDVKPFENEGVAVGGIVKAKTFDAFARRIGKQPGAIAEAELWAYVREQLISRPEWVADQTGIPEVARLADLPTPQPSPTLAEVGELYQKSARVSPAQRRRVALFWDDFQAFLEAQAVKTLRQLTATVAAEYGDKANAYGYSPKYDKHRYAAIRAAVSFAMKRGKHPDDCRHALDCCAVFEVEKQRGGRDPKPIERDDFAALLNATDEPRLKAWLLVMLNLAMYPQEAVNLDWGEIDLAKRTVVTDRSKTTVIRIGVLWEQTAEALKAIKPSGARAESPVFMSRQGNRLSVKTATKHFRHIRERADVAEAVKAEHCRDGAYTAAIESGAELETVKLLAGHATGISDHYVARKPTMVAEACAAIERHYFG